MRVGSSMLDLVGRTPVVRLARVVPEGAADVLVKLEWFNPTGSYKDRMALTMIEEAEWRGELMPGMTVVECTGGSTGSSLAYVCAAKGYRLQVVTSDVFAEEKLKTIAALGAELVVLPSDGGITSELITRMIERARALASEPGTYWTDQLNNRDALVGYRGIGEELLEQLDGHLDVFCGAVGTAGMTMGVAEALEAGGSVARVVVLEPAASPAISSGTAGVHRVDGIGLGFVPPLLDPDRYDEVRAIEEAEARAMARRLAVAEGLFAGTSTGLNVTGAVRLAEELGPGHTVVTVACDTGLKYLADDLFAP
jgi:cysteine synthase